MEDWKSANFYKIRVLASNNIIEYQQSIIKNELLRNLAIFSMLKSHIKRIRKVAFKKAMLDSKISKKGNKCINYI